MHPRSPLFAPLTPLSRLLEEPPLSHVERLSFFFPLIPSIRRFVCFQSLLREVFFKNFPQFLLRILNVFPSSVPLLH